MISSRSRTRWLERPCNAACGLAKAHESDSPIHEPSVSAERSRRRAAHGVAACQCCTRRRRRIHASSKAAQLFSGRFRLFDDRKSGALTSKFGVHGCRAARPAGGLQTRPMSMTERLSALKPARQTWRANHGIAFFERCQYPFRSSCCLGLVLTLRRERRSPRPSL
jgi:hypothetical protein